MSLSRIAPTPPFLYAVAKYTMWFLARRTVRFCIAKERIYANPEQTDARLDLCFFHGFTTRWGGGRLSGNHSGDPFFHPIVSKHINYLDIPGDFSKHAGIRQLSGISMNILNTVRVSWNVWWKPTKRQKLVNIDSTFSELLHFRILCWKFAALSRNHKQRWCRSWSGAEARKIVNLQN